MRGGDHAEPKAFATVVTHGGFAHAVEGLRISASTLSQTIRQPEARLGLWLLNRTTRGLPLTGAARPRSGGS